MDNHNPAADPDHPDRETHDFMNVDSFSQLPFIRPASLKDKDKDKPLRLFGFDFSHPSAAAANPPEDSSKADSDAARRFECHYCCRNFPTSQALGGHQNAHKRERQNAKRAHLHSAMASTDGHIYGLLNYRIASASSPTYPSWNNGTGTRVFGDHTTSYSTQQPINGSPLGMWRIPAAVQSGPNGGLNRYRSTSSMSRPLPLFAGDELNPVQVAGSGQQSGFVYEPSSTVQDHLTANFKILRTCEECFV